MSEQVQSSAGALPPGITMQLGAKVLAAAQADDGFREAFLEDPKAAYKGRFGEELLPGEPIEIRHLKDGATALYLTNYKKGILIPAKGEELSDDMLEMVAGGKGSSGKDTSSQGQAEKGAGVFLGELDGLGGED
jgi:hypothetical protein